LHDGRKITVNLDRVEAIYEHSQHANKDTRTMISFGDNNGVDIRMPYEDVKRNLSFYRAVYGATRSQGE